MRNTIIILLSLIMSFGQTSNAQNNDNDAAAAAAIFGIAAAAAAIEKHKENLELEASSHIIANYSDFNEFRLKVIGWGNGGKKWSDDGQVSFFPFLLEIMKDGSLTGEKHLLVCFASSGWANDFGLDITKLNWDLFSIRQWNELILRYADLSPPTIIDNFPDFAPASPPDTGASTR